MGTLPSRIAWVKLSSVIFLLPSAGSGVFAEEQFQPLQNVGGAGTIREFAEMDSIPLVTGRVRPIISVRELAQAAQLAPAAQPVDAPPSDPPPTDAPPPDIFSTDPAAFTAPRGTRHEISVSGDFFLAQGTVTMPFGFSLSQVPGLGANVTPNVSDPSRDSEYYGGTISYSFGQAWYFDVGYAHGSSSGNADVILTATDETLPSAFTIEDDWFQAYVRYTFPRLRGRRLSAYLRAGVSYVQATLTDDTVHPALGLYHQTDETTDLLGNLGFGLGYTWVPSRRTRLGLQFEGEGFFGFRTQESQEVLSQSDITFPPADIDNTLFGGIGRATVRFEYRLGRSELFRIFADGGFQGKYTLIDYKEADAPNELLWGPYVKLGARYAF